MTIKQKTKNYIIYPIIPLVIIFLIYSGFKSLVEEKLKLQIPFQPNTITDISIIFLALLVLIFYRKKKIISNKQKTILIINYSFVLLFYLYYRLSKNYSPTFITLTIIQWLAYLDIVVITIYGLFIKKLLHKSDIIKIDLKEEFFKSDTRIQKPEHDFLTRSTFAEDIAQGMIDSFENNHNSIVIGLNGIWGSGKSSLFELIKFQIDEMYSKKENSNKYAKIDFNPWMFSGQEHLQSIFLNQLADQIHIDSDLSKKIHQLTETLELINENNPEENSKNLLKNLLGLITINNGKKSLADVKSEINKTITDNNIRLYIFIDDIDRILSVKEISEILKLIKLNADFKNTVFLIAIDKDIVSEMLANEFGENGKKYLDKIIQVDYTVPALTDKEIKSIFDTELNKVFTDCKIHQTQGILGLAWNDGLKNYFQTVRDIYRYANALRLRLKRIHKDVFLRDFLVIEAIRMFDYKTYVWIYEKRIEITSSYDVHSIENIEGLIDNTIGETSKKLIISVFKTYVESVPYEEQKALKYICTLENIDKYFTLKILSSEISKSDIEVFLSNRAYDIKNSLFQDIIARELFNDFCEQLISTLKNNNTIPDSYKSDIFKLLKENSDRLKKNSTYSTIETDSEFDIMIDTLNKLVDCYKDREKGQQDYFKIIIEHNRVEFTSFFLSYYLDKLINLENDPDNKLLNAFNPSFLIKRRDEVDRYFKQALESMTTWKLSSPDQVNNFDLHFIIRVLLEHNRDAYNKKIEDWFKYPKAEVLLKLFELCLSWVKTGKFYYGLVNYKIKYPSFSVEKFDAALSTINTPLPNHEKTIKDLFLKLKSLNFPSHKYYSVGDFDEFKLARKVEFHFENQAPHNNDPRYNHHFFPEIIEFEKVGIEIDITPPEPTKFWRVGFKFSEDETIDYNKNSVHLCIGHPDELPDRTFDWKHKNRMELTPYDLQHVNDRRFGRYEEYKGEVVTMMLSKRDLSSYAVSIFVAGKLIGYEIYDLSKFKYCRIAAWCDQIEFELDTTITFAEYGGL